MPQDTKDYLVRNQGKIIGAILGLIFSILLLTIGVFKTIIIFVFTFAGYFLGCRIDQKGSLQGIINRFFPPDD